MPVTPLSNPLQGKDRPNEELNQDEMPKKNKKSQEQGEKKYEKLITNAKFLNDMAEKLINILGKHSLFQKILNRIVDIKIKERFQTLEKQLSAMNQKIEAQEQYTRRNCQVFHRIDNSPHAHTDELIKKFAWENLDVEIYDTDIDHSH